MEAAAEIFFTSKYFAVAGATQSSQKFGYKLLQWYQMHSLPVTPITPVRSTVTVSSNDFSRDYATIASTSALPRPMETSLSIVTQPSITKIVLREAKEAGIPAVWLQPGSYDEDSLTYAIREFRAAIGGVGGAGKDGWCVLVDGEKFLRKTKAETEDLKL